MLSLSVAVVLFLATILFPIGTCSEGELNVNTLMPNTRESLDDCQLRFYNQGKIESSGFAAFAIPAFLTEFAHLGAIGWTQKDGGINWGCGGSLIWENFLVTAAHCIVNDENVAPDVVRFGDLNLQNDTDDYFAQQLKITGIFPHTLYKFGSNYYDIALIRLERNITVHETVAPACLWFDEEMRFRVLESAGWGRTGFGEDQSPILLKVNLKPFTNEECSDYYSAKTVRGLRSGLVDHHICAGDEKMDTCQGDSGGPLHVRLLDYNLVTPFIVGLTSFGGPCGQSLPGVYTKISPFRSWFLETLQKNGAPEATDSQFEPQACAKRYINIRQRFDSHVVANASGVFERFNNDEEYITSYYVKEVVRIKWPATVTEAKTNCMGSVIDYDTVVTLGDCASKAGISPTQVVHLGWKNFQPHEREYKVKEIHVHPNHTSGSYYNNIAVMKIEGSFDFPPMCIAKTGNLSGQKAQVLSFGRDTTTANNNVRIFPYVKLYENDNCTFPNQYRESLKQGLQNQHLCFGNDPFLVPQACDLASGGPLQNFTYQSNGWYRSVYGISLFGRDCGYGEPAVAVRLYSHMAWLQSVMLPHKGDDRASARDLIHYINPDMELLDRCDTYYDTPGLCVPIDRCRGVRHRLRNSEGFIFCTNQTVVCCQPSDVLDDEQLQSEAQELENCEDLYRSFRRQNVLGTSERPDPKPFMVQLLWRNESTREIRSLCSGYLITTGTVITNAICTLVPNKTLIAVRLGYLDKRFEDSEAFVRIGRIISHPQYDDKTGANNIALVKLSSPIQPTIAIHPGCLWRSETHTPLILTLRSVQGQIAMETSMHPQYLADCSWIIKRPMLSGHQCMFPVWLLTKICPRPADPIVWRQVGDDGVPIEFLVGLYSQGGCNNTEAPIITSHIATYFSWIMENI